MHFKVLILFHVVGYRNMKSVFYQEPRAASSCTVLLKLARSCSLISISSEELKFLFGYYGIVHSSDSRMRDCKVVCRIVCTKKDLENLSSRLPLALALYSDLFSKRFAETSRSRNHTSQFKYLYNSILFIFRLQILIFSDVNIKINHFLTIA